MFYVKFFGCKDIALIVFSPKIYIAYLIYSVPYFEKKLHFFKEKDQYHENENYQ